MSSSDHSMGRENDMKMVIDNLRRDLCSMEGELERSVEKLQQTERKCEELAETVARLLEEKKVSEDREKRAEERCEKVLAENCEITFRNNNFIVELLKKVDELRDKNSENECLVGFYKEKYKCSDMKIVKIDQEMEDLKQERLAAANTIEELKRENVEAKKTIHELRFKKLDSDKVVEEYRTGLEIFRARNKKRGEDDFGPMTEKIREVINFFNEMRKLAASEEGTSLGFPVSEGNNSNGITPGDRDPVQPRTREVDDTALETPLYSQSVRNPPPVECDKHKEPLDSGAHATGMSGQLMSGEGHLIKTKGSSPAARDIIEIPDSDDEEKPVGAAAVPNVGETRMNKRKRNNMSRSGEEAGPSLHSQAPLAKLNGLNEKVQCPWRREALQKTKAIVFFESRRTTVESIVKELKLIGDEVYQELTNSCFGYLMKLDTQGGGGKALHYLFTREVIKADAGPDELWYCVGGRLIRFSKYEYALVTGLSFRPSTFDTSAEHHPPATGLFFRHYGGQDLSMNSLQTDFINGVFRRSPDDALKVAKLLIVYFLLFGKDGRKKIDLWAWTLIEDSKGWEMFNWGKHSFQILLRYLRRVPTVLKNKESPIELKNEESPIELKNEESPLSYHVYGSAWALLIWAYEAIPELGISCGVRRSYDALPRCLRWKFQKTRMDMNGFYDQKMEVHSTLNPSADELRQSYWANVCPNNPSKKKTRNRQLGPAVPPGFEALSDREAPM